jgi:hypothetical protein
MKQFSWQLPLQLVSSLPLRQTLLGTREQSTKFR